MAKLSVNVNKIATLRNSRGPGAEPRLRDMLEKIVSQGVTSITAHPRADERHITPRDIGLIHEILKSHGARPEMNWEGDLREGFLDLLDEHPPHQATLVPVSYGETTSHRGYDVRKWDYLLAPVLRRLKDRGVRVSIFISPGDLPSVTKAAEMGFDRVEIFTQPYAEKSIRSPDEETLAEVRDTARYAHKLGLGVNAGHDLNLKNLPALMAEVPEIIEVSVGHHLICDALMMGLEKAVQAYLQCVAHKMSS